MNRREKSNGWTHLWQIAGSLPVDIRTLTLRQLVWMMEGRDKFVWNVASSMMSVIANCHRGKGRAFRPQDFNPTVTRRERLKNAILITDDNVDVMRDEFKKVFQ